MKANLIEIGSSQIEWNDPRAVATHLQHLIRHEHPFTECHDRLNELLMTKPMCESWKTYLRLCYLVDRYRLALAEGSVCASDFKEKIGSFPLE